MRPQDIDFCPKCKPHSDDCVCEAKPASFGNSELLPCPFCGCPAEVDMQRAYTPIDGGPHGKQVAIYCHNCPADMSVCREDVPEATAEELYAELRGFWNARAR